MGLASDSLAIAQITDGIRARSVGSAFCYRGQIFPSRFASISIFSRPMCGWWGMVRNLGWTVDLSFFKGFARVGFAKRQS